MISELYVSDRSEGSSLASSESKIGEGKVNCLYRAIEGEEDVEEAPLIERGQPCGLQSFERLA